ncbi:MAG TPA: L-serine ammonia-lyase [Lentisphaeria bacterium]|nr:MAG: L-serine ammonia-lyase [Lentisphaerae bacterium GWF2_49_21]HBC86285.1 L-serine ammonia-lyase [Lentisphaeria bacterium]
MQSIKEIFKIGNGPSSSHTMGPKFAAERFKRENPGAEKFRVTLYGSLAATGRGHLTDKAIIDVLKPASVEFVWKPKVARESHTNPLVFDVLSPDGSPIASKRFYSVGGGTIIADGEKVDAKPVYKQKNMNEILKWCHENGQPVWKYVVDVEGEDVFKHLGEVWKAMKESLARGLDTEGVLPGGIKLERKARSYYYKAKRNDQASQKTGLLSAYALAVSEENASGGIVVTAPTCGSCGVIPSVLKILQETYNFSDDDILKALATAGHFGNVIKANASISGAEVGCQGEIGSACSMAAAAAAQLLGGTVYQVEYAAEMAMEHHLGLTCDPVMGLVQIPCIERNVFAAARALTCAEYALFSDGRHRISFDEVIETMRLTGHDLKSSYRETAQGGLAKLGEFNHTPRIRHCGQNAQKNKRV